MVKVLATVDVKGVHDVAEAARLLGLGEATVWRRINNGTIIAVKIGNRTVVPDSEITRLQNNQGG